MDASSASSPQIEVASTHPQRGLGDCPLEILLEVAEFAHSQRDLNTFARTNKCFYAVLNRSLYERNVKRDGSSALVWAAWHGHPKTAHLCLKAGADVHAKAELYQDMLSAPEAGGDLLFKAILAARYAGDVESDDEDECNIPEPLHLAAGRGHDDIVKLLLDGGANPNSTVAYDELTPLSYAAQFGKEAVVKRLLACPDIELCYDGVSPLEHAVDGGYAGIVKLLVEDPKMQAIDFDGEIPRMVFLAVRTAETEIVEILLRQGRFDVNSVDSLQTTLLHEATKTGSLELVRTILAADGIIDPRDSRDRTPLYYAAEHGYEQIVKLLLAVGQLDPNQADVASGKTPLHHAATGGMIETARALVGYERTHPDLEDVEGRTPLEYAICGNHEELVDLLLSTPRVDASHKSSKDGRTPLFHAASRGHEAVVKRLLSIKNIVPDEIDLFGLTPLREAVVGGHLGACKLLLETGGVDSNRKFGGGTVLHQAASRGHTEIVEVLLSMGTVDPNSRDKRHRTPLHWAAVHERVQTVNLLLANEAVDPNAQDDFGRTPLHLSAWHNRNSGIVNMLLLAKGVKEDVRDKKRRDPIYYALKRHPLNVRILDLLFETDFVASLPELISMADDFRSQEFAALLQDTATDLEVEWC